MHQILRDSINENGEMCDVLKKISDYEAIADYANIWNWLPCWAVVRHLSGPSIALLCPGPICLFIYERADTIDGKRIWKSRASG